MLFKIASVGQSNDGKTTFINDLLGRIYFPKSKDMEVQAGHYAYSVEVEQTKTYDAQGELVDLATPRKLQQITAIWATKQQAIEALAEMNLLSAEVTAETSKQAKALNLSDTQVAALANAW